MIFERGTARFSNAVDAVEPAAWLVLALAVLCLGYFAILRSVLVGS